MLREHTALTAELERRACQDKLTPPIKSKPQSELGAGMRSWNMIDPCIRSMHKDVAWTVLTSHVMLCIDSNNDPGQYAWTKAS